MLLWQRSILVGLVFVLLFRGCAGQTVTARGTPIRLENMWAYSMPGTHDIRELNPSSQIDLVESIQLSIGKAVDRVKANEGFVVQGNGSEALQKAYDLLVSGAPVPKQIRSHEETWIVFFSHNSMQFVHLDKITRNAEQISVRYRFVPHDSKEMSCHFALIALGTLPAGEYTVAITKSPMEKRYIDAGYRPIAEPHTSKIVCRSFEFHVLAGNE